MFEMIWMLIRRSIWKCLRSIISRRFSAEVMATDDWMERRNKWILIYVKYWRCYSLRPPSNLPFWLKRGYCANRVMDINYIFFIAVIVLLYRKIVNKKTTHIGFMDFTNFISMYSHAERKRKTKKCKFSKTEIQPILFNLKCFPANQDLNPTKRCYSSPWVQKWSEILNFL